MKRLVTGTFRRFFLLLAAGCLASPGISQNLPPLSFVFHDSAASQGYYFLSPYTNTPPFIYNHAQLILDNLGRVVFYRVFPKSNSPNATIDFKLQPEGHITYFDINRNKHMIMDSTFTVVDSIECLHGFITDQHDLRILPNHHYLLFGTENRIMNLSSYHYFGINHTTPGATNAQVMGVVIQEFDENKTLVWEWKGHDHYSFSDVDPVWLFSPSKVDWTHANAVEQDGDGNILISLRHFDEITKIDHASGNILWRFGGKQNQFTFLNDPTRFTGQHDVRRTASGNLSFFDNGQYTNPAVCRAVEYSLDENAKTSQLTWEYIYDSNMYSVACGNHYYIDNGNHLVDFGFVNSAGLPWMVVVRPDKSEVMEIHYPAGYISYRAFNYLTLPWQLHRPAVTCRRIGSQYYLEAEEGHPEYQWSTGDTTAMIPIADTGDYWVFVPYGSGYISSEHVRITDPLTPCFFAGVPPVPTIQALSVLPNPASGSMHIAFALDTGSPVSFALVDRMGRERCRRAEERFASGRHEIRMNLAGIEPGLYFLRMNTPFGTTVIKVAVKSPV